jgi:integrase
MQSRITRYQRIRITDEYSLVKRKGSDNWYLEWRERGEKQRRSCGTPSLDAAKVEAREIILATARIIDQPPASMPVSVVIDRYMAKVGSQIASKSAARASAKLWMQFFAQDTVADLRPDRLDYFLTWLRERGYSAGYVRRVMMLGKAALNRAWKRQEITSTPYIQLPPDGEPWPHVAKRAELVRFLNAIAEKSNVWTYAMIRLNTGCRDDAARDLQPFQVDFDANLIRLNPPSRAQTKKYRPVIPLTSTLRAVLKRAVDAPFYVTSHRKGKRLGSIRKGWSAIRKQAKLPATFAPKILRHTVASELRRRGVPGWEVSGLLGHKRGDAHSTTNVYAKFDPEFLGNARGAIDAWMTDLARDVPRLRGVTAGSVIVRDVEASPEEFRAVAGFQVVGSTGIEPVTPTMSRSRKGIKNKDKKARKGHLDDAADQAVTTDAGSVRGHMRKLRA